MEDSITTASSTAEKVQSVVDHAGGEVSSGFVVGEAVKQGVPEVEAYRALILLADEGRIRMLPGLRVAPSKP